MIKKMLAIGLLEKIGQGNKKLGNRFSSTYTPNLQWRRNEDKKLLQCHEAFIVITIYTEITAASQNKKLT